MTMRYAEDGTTIVIDDVTFVPNFENAPSEIRQMILDAGGIEAVEPYTPPAITANQVKLEANHRIEAITPDYKQRNSLALGVEAIQTYGTDVSQWPEQLQTLNTVIQQQWTLIKEIRTCSNHLELLDPIPADYTDNKYWTIGYWEE